MRERSDYGGERDGERDEGGGEEGHGGGGEHGWRRELGVGEGVGVVRGA